MLDPFDILGLPPTFDIAPQELRAAFLARSREIHPDVTASNDSDEGAANLNNAKRTLENPETRAEALLARLGGPSKERDRSLPPAFLQQMLEVREQIEAAVASGSPAQRSDWERWAESERQSHIRNVAGLFRDHQKGGAGSGGESGGESGGGGTPEVLHLIRMELNMWRYVERLIEQLTDPAGGASL